MKVIVEDEAKIASFIVKGLEGVGYETEHVVSGAEAIERAPDADVMVLDLGLPDLDGIDVLRRVRERDVETQIIVLTARAELADRVHGLEHGADDYLVKPFAFEELLARIRARQGARTGRTPSPERARHPDGPPRSEGVGRRQDRGAPRETVRATRGVPAETGRRPHARAAARAGVGPSIPARTSSTSTWATCDGRSVRSGSRRCAIAGIGSPAETGGFEPPRECYP